MLYVEEEYFSAEEVAERLKVHRRSVLRWIAAGKLRGYRLSAGNVRITRKDLERF
jgi:excisionase family DNA binding protein